MNTNLGSRKMFREKREVNGYKQIKGTNRWFYIHRYLVELRIGRKLRQGEQVHHINKNKRDNSEINITNLMAEDHKWEHKISFEQDWNNADKQTIGRTNRIFE